MDTWKISEILLSGLSLGKRNWLPLIGASLILTIFTAPWDLLGAIISLPAFNALPASIAVPLLMIAALLSLIGPLAMLYLVLGQLRMTLKAVDGSSPRLASLLSTPLRALLRACGASIVIGLALAIPAVIGYLNMVTAQQAVQPEVSVRWLIALACAGGCAYLLFRSTFIFHVLIDRDLTVGKGLRLGWEITEGQMLKLIGLQLILWLPTFASFLEARFSETASGQLTDYMKPLLGLFHLAVWQGFSILCHSVLYRRLVQSKAPGCGQEGAVAPS